MKRGINKISDGEVEEQDDNPIIQPPTKKAKKDLPEAVLRGFAELKAANISSEENPEIYQMLEENPDKSEGLAKGFLILRNKDITFQKHPDLYQFLMRVGSPETFAQAMVVLDENWITYQEHSQLYEMLNGLEDPLPVAKGFARLHQKVISFSKNPEIYQQLINFGQDAEWAAEIVPTLLQAKYPVKMKDEFIEAVLKSDWIDLHSITAAIWILIGLGLTYDKHPEYYHENLLVNKATLIMQLERKIHKAGLLTHKRLLIKIFEQVRNEQITHQTLIHNVNKLCAYHGSHKSDPSLQASEYAIVAFFTAPFHKRNLQAHEDAMMAILDETSVPWNELTFGPLNKSEGTLTIEALLKQLSQKDSASQARIIFKEPDTYFLELPGQQPVNLSILLRNTNLSHLTLPDDQINALGEIIKSLIGEKWKNESNLDPILRLLPEAEQVAISLYTHGTKYHINMNKLFRAEAFDADENLKLHSQEDKNSLVHFLLGCLVNNAANKIPNLGWHVQGLSDNLDKLEKHHQVNIRDVAKDKDRFVELVNQSKTVKVVKKDGKAAEPLVSKEDAQQLIQHRQQFDDFLRVIPKRVMLVRWEALTDEQKRFRLANPWRLPSVTSFSDFKDGCKIFRQKGSRTNLEEGSEYFTIESAVANEGEVLLAHGECMATIQGPGFQCSRLVRSPKLEKNHYWSELALQFACESHLFNVYKDEDDSLKMGEITIARRNHGPAPTYRGMNNIDLLVDFFKTYSSDPGFKKFCEEMTEKEIEWLRVAAALRYSGRESETTAVSAHFDKYEIYREASAQNFVKFVKQFPEGKDTAMVKRLSDVIRYMGNPDYEKKINLLKNKQERMRRNYLFCILSEAHFLDLPRCKDEEKMKLALEFNDRYIENSDSQQADRLELVRYNLDLIKAHGDALCCDMDISGKFIKAKKDYDGVFPHVSTSLKRLFEVTETIPRPIIGRRQTLRAG